MKYILQPKQWIGGNFLGVGVSWIFNLEQCIAKWEIVRIFPIA